MNDRPRIVRIRVTGLLARFAIQLGVFQGDAGSDQMGAFPGVRSVVTPAFGFTSLTRSAFSKRDDRHRRPDFLPVPLG